MSGLGITEITNTIKSETNALYFGNKYNIYINSPKSGMLKDEISLQANSVVYPGRSFMTTEWDHNGPMRSIPYQSKYEVAAIQFYVQNNFEVVKYFTEWMNLIENSGEKKGNFYIAFYEDIIGTVAVVPLSESGEELKGIVLQEAYPVSMADIQLAYENSAPVSLSVSFAFRYSELMN